MITTSSYNGDVHAALEAALKLGDNLYVDKAAPIDRTLFIHQFDEDYKQVSISVYGDGKKADNGKRSVIKATFNDGPIIAIQKGKGCVIQGLNLQGPSIGQDTRFGPQAGIAIDPVCYQRPVDGGYASLPYQGSPSKGGSTGIRIEDCTTNNTTVGIITSPNGYTQNADCISIINHRFGNHKYGLAGCQDQEKDNKVRDFQAWGKVDVLFQFNKYGAAKPGHWVIDGGNIAGNVKSIIYRSSHKWQPMFMRDVYGESLENIGFWDTELSDSMTDCTFKFNIDAYPAYHLSGKVLPVGNTIRFYSTKKRPMVFVDTVQGQGNIYDNEVLRLPKHTSIPEVRIVKTGEVLSEGATVIMYNPLNYTFLSSGIIENGQIKSNYIPDSYRLGVKSIV